MSLTLYKPNAASKGCLLSINFVAKADKIFNQKIEKGDKSGYFNLVSQTGWIPDGNNSKKGIGSFKDGKKITVKLALHEVSGILSAIERNTTLAEAMGVEYVYHDGKESSTTIYFGPHFKKVKEGDKWVDTDKQIGFSLRVVKTNKSDKNNKDNLAIGFTWAETKMLESFLKDGQNHIFAAMKASDINKFKDKKREVEESTTQSDTEENGEF